MVPLEFIKVAKFGFQDSATPIMEGIIDLHNYIFFYLVLIFTFVLVIFINIVYEFNFKYRYYLDSDSVYFRKDLLDGNKITHGTSLELIWTIIPSFILILIAIPSFSLLYAMDEIIEPILTVKVTGHQWYWTYEGVCNVAGDLIKGNLDQHMLFEDELNFGELRLLQCDEPLDLPINVHMNVLVTSSDVLHSWAVPSLGFKIDAIPGRLNQFHLYIKREGVYYGQCSELCGVNHGFMPIMIRAFPFSVWAESALRLQVS